MHNRTIAPLCAGNPDAQPAPRRSRRAAAAIATTIGAAAVVSSTFATPADAAPRAGVWDRVASCESSQRWHINTGNGYYGGLQFSASTWAGYHGHRYARLASRASRAEQIAVARRVLAAQGPHAWPVCGPRAGLSRRTGHATHAPLPRIAGRKAHRRAHRARHHHAARHHHRHAARHHHHHAARHHHHHAARHHHRHSLRHHHSVRHHHAHQARRHHHATYRVRRGDTLGRIARRLHVQGGWKALYRVNRHRLGNPNVLHVGQLLRLP
jgi:nucleoid-associated protein YgaU